MSPHAATAICSIDVIACGAAEPRRAQLWQAIAEAWPRFAPGPSMRTLALDEAVTDPSTPAAVLVDLRPGHDARMLTRLLDALWERSTPALLLVDDGHRLADRLASDGVLVLDDDAPPGVIAATLATLAVRQSSVDHLRRELSIARRFQGGLSGQMDKLHEELQLAAIVQKELLPKSIPSVPGFDMHVFFRSAGYVSGDIYDVQRLDEHRLGFFVADAVGHGVPAALMTMIIARGMHMTQIRQGEVETLSPAEVLCELNRDLSRQEGNAPRFATAVCGILDGRDRTVRLAGAGHPHPLVLRADGTHRPVETTGGLLGIFAEDSFEEVTVQLEEDELLVVYSDGFETAFPEDGVGGYERRLPTRNYIRCFDQSAAHWRNDGLTAAAMHLAEQVNEQSGSLHQIDDLTAMLIAPNSTGS